MSPPHWFEVETVVVIECRIIDGALSLLHDGELLQEDALEHVIDRSSSCALEITDFEHDGMLCCVNAFTIRADGTLEPWQRAADRVTSPPISVDDQAAEFYAVVIPVAHKPIGEVTAGEPEGLTLDSWHTNVFVRVRPKGSTLLG